MQCIGANNNHGTTLLTGNKLLVCICWDSPPTIYVEVPRQYLLDLLPPYADPNSISSGLKLRVHLHYSCIVGLQPPPTL